MRLERSIGDDQTTESVGTKLLKLKCPSTGVEGQRLLVDLCASFHNAYMGASELFSD